MIQRRRDRSRSAILALGLALGAESAAHAQNPNLSTGSGVGTGAGAGAVERQRRGRRFYAGTGAGAGAMSARGPGSLGRQQHDPPARPAAERPHGVRAGSRRLVPDGPVPRPVLAAGRGREPGQGPAGSRVTADLLRSARDISDPAERSLALRQIANGAIAASQMVLAHQLLEEAIAATSQVTVPLVRDQRLIGLVSRTTRWPTPCSGWDAKTRASRPPTTRRRRGTPREALAKHPEPKV